MRTAFIGKLIDRIDKIDPHNLQTQFLRLAHEQGLLETIFQSIQEGIIVVDAAGKLSYANRAAESLLGFSFETSRGRPMTRYLRDIDLERVMRFDEAEWSKLINQELELTYPQHRFLSFYVVPLALTGEQQNGALIMLRDVTHSRLHETAVVETERINAIKLLAAGVAHEIGNPLNALHIHLQLLERQIRKLPENCRGELRELVEVAGNEVQRLDLIITQFLRAIRPSKPKLVPSRVDTLLKETLLVLKQEIQNRRIDVEIDSAEPIPKVHLDRAQMKQVFFNVIRNAFEAMSDGGSLRVTLFLTDQYLGIGFRDTGEGIRMADMGRIFEPYQSTKSGGTGLGLMIVQRIIQDHGGHIEVSSKLDKGTRFTIFLPLVERRVRLLKAGRQARAADDSEPQPDRGGTHD